MYQSPVSPSDVEIPLLFTLKQNALAAILKASYFLKQFNQATLTLLMTWSRCFQDVLSFAAAGGVVAASVGG